MKVMMDARGDNGRMSFANNWLEESCWEGDDRKNANNESESSRIEVQTTTWTARIRHTNNIQGSFRTTDYVTPVSLYSAVHSVRWYTMYGTLHTHQRMNENSLPRWWILPILLQKGNDVLQKAHQPLTINKRNGGGEEWAKGEQQRTNVVAKEFDSNDVASINFRTRCARKSKKIHWMVQRPCTILRTIARVNTTRRWVPGNNERVNSYRQVTWGTWSLMTHIVTRSTVGRSQLLVAPWWCTITRWHRSAMH